jgi:hypothetical protein
MKRLTTLLLILLPVAVFIAAAPICPLVGTWAGEGKGSVYPPGTVMYPWQYWKGKVTDNGKAFYGEWKDEKGNHGEFKGEIDWISLKEAVCKGEWTWDNPIGIPHVAGKFKMFFYPYEKECKGEWTSIYPSPSAQGIMWGKKVD